jgi:hypothetical protein
MATEKIYGFNAKTVQEYIYVHIYISIIHNSQKVETIQIDSIDE